MDKSTINGHFNRPGNHDLSNTNAVMVISRAFPKAVPEKKHTSRGAPWPRKRDQLGAAEFQFHYGS